MRVFLAIIIASGLFGFAAESRADGEFRVTLLGTASPAPRVNRFGPSTLVEAGGQVLLFDAGRGVPIRMGQIKIPIGRIEALFLTHFHSDHTSGIPDIWLTGWLGPVFGRRQQPFRVIGPTGTRDLMANLQKAYASGDTRYNRNVVKYGTGTDLLIHEVAVARPELMSNRFAQAIIAHHISPHDAGRVFAEARPKLAAYTHLVFLSNETVPEPTLDDVVAQTRETYEGPLEVGEDLTSFEIGDTVTVHRWKP
jgi:ribonuclease BN (tRNA processing enzyme)